MTNIDTTERLRILHVEDSPYDRDLVMHALTQGEPRFELTVATNRDSFFAALKPGCFDCVLSDFNILGFTGLQVFDAVQAVDPDLPVVILTGTGSEELAVEALKRGVADYILKSPQHIRRLPVSLEHVVMQARKALALRAAEAERQLAAVVFRSASEGIVVTDASARIIAVNPYFCEATGYPASEVLGQNPRLLKSGVHDAGFYHALWQSIASTGSWRGEITNRRRDGTLYQEWLAISAVRDAAGELTHYVGIFSDVPERRALNERLRHIAQYDALTDLPNRSLFLDRFEQALLTAQRFHRNVALLWLDLARFRIFNDTWGHRAGDALLKETARRLLDFAREGDTVARLSADEFAIVLANVGHESDIVPLAQRLVGIIAAPFESEGASFEISANIGISVYPKDGERVEVLLKAADAALARARQAGRDNFRFFAADMNIEAERRLRLEAALRGALERGELALHYQPQIDLASGQINGFEALLRWRHPELGAISPAEFIPLAEETGLIQAIGAWTVREACRQNKRWFDAGLACVPVAVNLSARQFHRPDLVDVIAAALADSGLPASLLELELTESAFITDVADAAAVIRRIKALGVLLALDDFGTGYSSLAYLSGFPFDKIKIDQSFVRDIITNPVNAAIATATIAMARSLNLTVLAEGVETDAQMQFLRTRQCEAMQGFLFSRALPADDVSVLLDSRRSLPLGDGQATQRTLLIVDDEPSILSSLKRLLHREGYRILVAEGPAVAFELLAKNTVQVIISDQRMPEMNGTEFFARVRQLYPETVRIVLSGYTDLESVTEAVNRGAIYLFLTKPWDDEALRAQVREAFRVAERQAHA